MLRATETQAVFVQVLQSQVLQSSPSELIFPVVPSSIKLYFPVSYYLLPFPFFFAPTCFFHLLNSFATSASRCLSRCLSSMVT